MGKITLEIVKDGNIEPCRDLCNALMSLQKSRARLHPELFDQMNFDTRMKKSYEGALRSQVAVAWDDARPIGYVFSTVDRVDEDAKKGVPAWAPKGENMMGFYPDWVETPQKIGCLNNLYLCDGYRGSGIGARLCDTTMEWLESFDDVALIFVYISNGNDDALKFYLKHGFTFSHDVFGGFIQAAYKRK